MPTWFFPEDIRKEYTIDELVKNGKVLAVIANGMYGLHQAGILAHQKLFKHLKEVAFARAKFTSGLFTHTTRPLAFRLVVDNFSMSSTLAKKMLIF